MRTQKKNQVKHTQIKYYRNTQSTNRNKKNPKNIIKKKSKLCINATRRNLQTQPNIMKKLSEHEINQSKLKQFPLVP
jgi:uncharacterized Fe-S cluster-containing protein